MNATQHQTLGVRRAVLREPARRGTGAAGIGVSELLQILEGSGLRLASSTRSSTTSTRSALTGTVFYDPWVPTIGAPGSVLLAIGAHPAAAETADLVRDAARLGFGAIVVKALSLDIHTLAAVADAENIALLVADDEIEWRQLDALISSALTTATDVPNSLSSLAVGDLFALANAIAAMVGGATAIEDMQERVLAYSTLPGQPIDEDRREGILGRQVPDLPENAEQYAAVFRAPGALWLPGVGPALDRLAVAVRAGTQPLGSIWIVDATGDLDADAHRALEGGADIAALHMLRSRSAADLVRQQRAELLRRVLEGGEDSRLAAGQLGLGSANEFVVLAFQPDFSPTADELRMSRLFDLIAMQCEAHQRGTECVVIGDTIYALFSGPLGIDPGGLRELARRLIARAQSALRVKVRASAGSEAMSIGQVNRSKHDADLVLLLLATRQTSSTAETRLSFASAHDVRSQLTLLELAQVFRDTPRLLSWPVKQLLESDARSGTEYAKTLRTYLDCSRDSAATATRLSLHQNTLRYRLRRVKELFGIDLSDADDTLTLWLSLRVVEFD